MITFWFELMWSSKTLTKQHQKLSYDFLLGESFFLYNRETKGKSKNKMAAKTFVYGGLFDLFKEWGASAWTNAFFTHNSFVQHLSKKYYENGSMTFIQMSAPTTFYWAFLCLLT